MAVRTEDIPARAFINAQMIGLANRNGDLDRGSRCVEQMSGRPKGSFAFVREAHVVSGLYCLMVVPKEVWCLDNNHSVLHNIDKGWLMKLFVAE